MRRPLAAIVSIGLCGAALEPLLRAPGDPDSDDFPLSTYPMFAAPRPAELTMAWARGVAPGGWRALAPDHLGTGEVMQAFATLQRAASSGPGWTGCTRPSVSTSAPRRPRRSRSPSPPS